MDSLKQGAPSAYQRVVKAPDRGYRVPLTVHVRYGLIAGAINQAGYPDEAG